MRGDRIFSHLFCFAVLYGALSYDMPAQASGTLRSKSQPLAGAKEIVTSQRVWLGLIPREVVKQLVREVAFEGYVVPTEVETLMDAWDEIADKEFSLAKAISEIKSRIDCPLVERKLEVYIKESATLEKLISDLNLDKQSYVPFGSKITKTIFTERLGDNIDQCITKHQTCCKDICALMAALYDNLADLYSSQMVNRGEGLWTKFIGMNDPKTRGNDIKNSVQNGDFKRLPIWQCFDALKQETFYSGPDKICRFFLNTPDISQQLSAMKVNMNRLTKEIPHEIQYQGIQESLQNRINAIQFWLELTSANSILNKIEDIEKNDCLISKFINDMPSHSCVSGLREICKSLLTEMAGNDTEGIDSGEIMMSDILSDVKQSQIYKQLYKFRNTCQQIINKLDGKNWHDIYMFVQTLNIAKKTYINLLCDVDEQYAAPVVNTPLAYIIEIMVAMFDIKYLMVLDAENTLSYTIFSAMLETLPKS